MTAHLNSTTLTAAALLNALEEGDSLITPGSRAVLPALPPGAPAQEVRIGLWSVSWSCRAGVLTLTLDDGDGLRVESRLNHNRVQSLFHVLTLGQVQLVTPGFRTRSMSDLLTTEVTFCIPGEAHSPCSVQVTQGHHDWVWLRSVLNHASNRFEVWQSARPNFLEPELSSGHLPVGFLEARGLDDVFRRAQHRLPVDDETEETAPAWDTRVGAGPLGERRPRSLSVGDQVVTPTGERFWVMIAGFQKI